MPRRSLVLPRPVAVAFALLVAWWILPPAIRTFSRTAFFEFQAPAWIAGSVASDLQDFWGLRARPKVELVEAGRDLARLNAQYELRMQEDVALRREIARLEKLLQLPSNPEYRSEIARVVRRDLGTWWQQITVRKGSADGIPAGAAVVFAGGVVGRVREVRLNTCTVDLVSSPSFRMAAHFEDDDRPVTYQGEPNLGFTAPAGRVSNVAPGVEAGSERPRRLVSSRLGGVFPDGWTIGWVDDLDLAPDGLFQQGRVRLDERLLSLKEVAILVPVGPSQSRP